LLLIKNVFFYDDAEWRRCGAEADWTSFLAFAVIIVSHCWWLAVGNLKIVVIYVINLCTSTSYYIKN